jgi:hypothetical protein
VISEGALPESLPIMKSQLLPPCLLVSRKKTQDPSMSSLEPEVQDFLKRIVSSLFIGLFWLIVNMTLGIYFGLLFVGRSISIGNIIFYIFLLGSLSLLIRFYYKTWKKKFPHG